MKKVLLTLFILLFTANCFAEGLGTLIKVAKDQQEIQKLLEEETKNFENVKKSIENGNIQKGQSKTTIERQYGGPVVIIPDERTNTERWVYKPASSSYFEGAKIYLIFDNTDTLQEAKIITKK